MRSTTGEALVSVVDALAQVEVEELCAAELQELIAVIGPQAGRLSGIVSAAVGALQVRTGGRVPAGPPAGQHSSPACPEDAPGPVVALRHWLRDTLSCGGPAAGAQVRVAVALRDLPQVAAAVTTGLITPEHARVLTRFLGCVDLQHLQAAQPAMIEVARRLGPEELTAWVRHTIATWCEPQHDHDTATAHTKRYLQTRHLGDGTTRGTFLLPTESLESFFTVLEPLARPTGLDDPRSAGQRRADALLEVFDRAVTQPDLPDSGGLRTQLHYVIPAGWAAGHPPPPFADLTGATLPGASTPPARAGCAVGVWTGPATRARTEALLCDAQISRALLNPARQIASLESVRGQISRAQRRALLARDLGCASRGCTRPPAFCDAHHLQARADGGATTLDNLVLLCRRHHLLWHQGRLTLHDLHVPWLTHETDTDTDSRAGPDHTAA